MMSVVCPLRFSKGLTLLHTVGQSCRQYDVVFNEQIAIRWRPVLGHTLTLDNLDETYQIWCLDTEQSLGSQSTTYQAVSRHDVSDARCARQDGSSSARSPVVPVTGE